MASTANTADAKNAQAEDKAEDKRVSAKNDEQNGDSENKSEVSGQNVPFDGTEEGRNIQQEGEHLARLAEAEVYGDDYAAGDEYLYPFLPKSAQNPLRKNIILYRVDPDKV